MTMLEYALDYADRGLSVVPVHSVLSDGGCSCGSAKCSSPGKHPRFAWQGKENKPMTKKALRDLWDRYPDSNVGIVTGEVSGILVVDIDGEEGMTSLKDLGFDPHNQRTPRVRSGGNGLHLYYRYQKLPGISTRANIIHKVDIRTDGGMIVAPPSVHLSGNEYKWIEDFDIADLDPIEFDTSWIDFDEMGGKLYVLNESKFTKALRGVSEGMRNDTCAQLAGHFFQVGLLLDEVTVLIENWNEQNDPPMSHRDLEICIHSIARKDSKPDYGTKEEIFKSISKTLKLDIHKIIKISGNEPKYELVTERGVCKMTVDQMFSPSAFQASIAKGSGVSITRLRTSGNINQERMAGMIMEVAEELDAGEAATESGEIIAVLTQYLMTEGDPVICDDKTVPPHDTFQIGDTVWFHLNEFIHWGNIHFHLRTSIREGAQRLRSAGVDQANFHRADNKGTRAAWGIDLSVIGKEREDED